MNNLRAYLWEVFYLVVNPIIPVLTPAGPRLVLCGLPGLVRVRMPSVGVAKVRVPIGGCTPADGTPRIYCYSKLPLGEQSCRRCPIIWAVDFNSHCVLKAQQNNSGKKKEIPTPLGWPFSPQPC